MMDQSASEYKPTAESMTHFAAILEEGIQHHRAGRFFQAERAYLAILQNEPNHADALHLLGVMACRAGRLDVAMEYINRAITVSPQAPEYYNSLGAVWQAKGNEAEAVRLYLHAIQLKDDYLEPHNNILRLRPAALDVRFKLGYLLHRQGKINEALEQYDMVIELQPNHADALNNKGVVLTELGRFDEAIASLRQAVQVQPNYAEAYHNLGCVLQKKEAIAEAITSYHFALSINPEYIDAHLNLGGALQFQGNFYQAIEQYKKVLEIAPDCVKALYNWADALDQLGRDSEAVDKYAEAENCDPTFVEAHVNRAFVLLTNGRYQEGWPEYEWRLQRPDWLAANRIYPELTRWDGSVLADKTILVQAEQGFGDTIQFARYLPLVKTRCRRLIVEAQPELHPLLETVSAIDELVLMQPDNSHKADYAIHIMSLPGIFGTTIDSIPLSFPYLLAPVSRLEKWRNLIPPEGFRVGITWSGNPAYPGNKDRSCGVEQFAPLATLPGVRLFSLQKGQPAEQIQLAPPDMNIVDLGPDLHDFADTAAAIMHLDLVVSVDTALVHLAGALGRPVWTLRYFCPYWVWGKEGDRTPWYSSMRIFRQRHRGDWNTVLWEVFDQLEKVVMERVGKDQQSDEECAANHVIE